jgi:hypothetical protein
LGSTINWIITSVFRPRVGIEFPIVDPQASYAVNFLVVSAMQTIARNQRRLLAEVVITATCSAREDIITGTVYINRPQIADLVRYRTIEIVLI